MVENIEDGPRTGYQQGRISGSHIFTIKHHHSVTWLLHMCINIINTVSLTKENILSDFCNRLENMLTIQFKKGVTGYAALTQIFKCGYTWAFDQKTENEPSGLISLHVTVIYKGSHLNRCDQMLWHRGMI